MRYRRLSATDRDAFQAVRRLLVAGFESGEFHPSLRLKRVRGAATGVYEISWAQDGRATFTLEAEIRPGSGPHVVWRRVGSHGIFEDA